MRFLIWAAVICLTSCGVSDRFRGPEITPPDPLPSRDAVPIFAVLDTQAVRVEMDDGQVCLGASGADFSPAGWTGNLSECAYEYQYSVQLNAGALAGSTPLRPVEGLILPNDDSPPFRPIARVIVTDFLGRSYSFETTAGF